MSKLSTSPPKIGSFHSSDSEDSMYLKRQTEKAISILCAEQEYDRLDVSLLEKCCDHFSKGMKVLLAIDKVTNVGAALFSLLEGRCQHWDSWIKIGNRAKETGELYHIINYREPSTGFTLLMRATAHRDKDIVLWLIHAGADMDQGRLLTPIMIAAKHNYPDLVELFAHCKCDVDLRNCDGMSALMYACIHGNTECVQALIAGGADVNLSSFSNGLTVLMYACLYADKESVAILIENGADVNATSESGATPLMLVALKGNIDKAQILLKGGAKIDAVTDDGESAFSYSIFGYSNVSPLETPPENMALYFLKKGVFLQEFSPIFLLSALSWTLRKSHGLLARKIFTAACSTFGFVESLVSIKEYCYCDLPPRCRLRADHQEHHRCQSLDVMAQLFDANILRPDSIDNVFVKRHTLLTAAAHFRKPLCVEMLLEKGADVEMDDMFHMTPLGTAVTSGCRSSLVLLLQYGANPNNKSGVKALRYITPDDSKALTPLNPAPSESEKCDLYHPLTIAYALLNAEFMFVLWRVGACLQRFQLQDLQAQGDILRRKMNVEEREGDEHKAKVAVCEHLLGVFHKSARLLKDASRITIRRCLGTGIIDKVQLLPDSVSTKLRDFILMAELREIRKPRSNLKESYEAEEESCNADESDVQQ